MRAQFYHQILLILIKYSPSLNLLVYHHQKTLNCTLEKKIHNDLISETILTTMANAPIYLSLLSLLVAFFTLYITQLRPANVGVITGSTIGVNHQDDGFSIYLPLTFNNSAHSAGLIQRCSIVFSRADAGQTFHYIEWTDFRKRNGETNRYEREDFAGPIQIEGRSSLSKLVWFRWRTGDFPFTEGKYTFEVVAWKENDDHPSIRKKHSFYITKEVAVALAAYKLNKLTKIEFMGIDKQIESNKLVTEHELKKLLG